ncbi:rho GTPase-activating protein gacZ-like [Cotesia glomerata]|uniref:rho GTPase-activating protein gacZ-like n=1 Tax=Cotesia glomerata TaxID=32391 RepID=UPI001D0228FC|nr:rho GTPase-activating protein gacZ-like [Cotesia glomerata]
MLLINDATTVNETSHPHNHSIVFLVAKNIIFNLIGVNASATLSSLLQNNQSNSINNISFRTEPPLQNQFLTTFDSSTLVSTSTSVPVSYSTSTTISQSLSKNIINGTIAQQHSSPTDTLPLTSSYLSTEVNDRKNDVTDVLPSVELQSLVACSETNASPMPVSSSSVHIDNSKPDNDILNHSEQNETLSNSSLSSIDLKIHANTKMYKEQGSLQLIDDDNNSLSEDTKHLSYDYENNNVDNISNFDYDGDQKSNYENLKHERSDPIINFDDNDEELGNSNKILDEYRDFTEYFMT